MYHPFVCGPNNSTIRQLIEETGVKINVPPPSVMSDEIVVSGDKEGVMKCKATIMAIFEEKVLLLIIVSNVFSMKPKVQGIKHCACLFFVFRLLNRVTCT